MDALIVGTNLDLFPKKRWRYIDTSFLFCWTFYRKLFASILSYNYFFLRQFFETTALQSWVKS